jgi:short-subunit dehydrogenase
MGLAIARRFARDGYAIGLIARRREPLQAAAATMAGAPRVEVEAADLSDPIAAAGAVRTTCWSTTPPPGTRCRRWR